MSSFKDYYAILGLSPIASPVEVKKRYRELVRKYHPDVNSSPDAANRILAINEAYHTLGETEKRSHYDALRVLSRNGRPTRTQQSAPYGQPADSAGNEARTGVEFNGFGTTASAENAGFPAKPNQRTAPRKTAVAPDDIVIERMLMEARLAYVNRQFQKAEKYCLEVVKLTPTCAPAHELLGDVYAREGDTSRATTAYSYALQFNPRGRSAQTKMEQLVGNRITSQRPNQTVFTTQRFAVPAVPFSAAAFSAMSAIAACAILLAFITLFLSPGGVASFAPCGFQIAWSLIPALLLGGVGGGILLAFYGQVRPSRLELWKTPLPEDVLPLKMGIFLIVTSLVSFYLSFAAWVAVGLAKKPLSVSILRSYGVAFALTLLSTFAYHPTNDSPPQTLFIGIAGSVVFPAVLVGWFLGDKFRLRGQLL